MLQKETIKKAMQISYIIFYIIQYKIFVLRKEKRPHSFDETKMGRTILTDQNNPGWSETIEVK